MKLIDKIDYPKFIDEVLRATHHLYLSLPSIDDEIAEVLIRKANEITIKVLIDNSEEAIRNGFGEITGIEKLIQSKIQIFQSEGNLVSFIISDDVGYFLFPQSKIFLEKAKGSNAFKIDPVTIQLLIQHFFPTEKQTDENKFSQAATIGDSIKHFETAFQENSLNVSVSQFDNEKYEGIKKKLKVNPPLSPNLQRQINTYTAKIQFVELKFSGGNLENRIAQLPKKAIPINSDELKNLLLTRIKMFQDISKNPDYQKFQELKDKIEKLRKDFLTPITCRQGKSIIKMEMKEKFIEELSKLKEETKKLNEVLTTMLEEGKLNTVDLLRAELRKFFNANEPQELKDINKPDIKQRKLDSIINTIVSSVKFPEVHTLIDKIFLSELFYDLTWNDFKDEKLHKEFAEKKIMVGDDIDSIVKMKDAFEAKQ